MLKAVSAATHDSQILARAKKLRAFFLLGNSQNSGRDELLDLCSVTFDENQQKLFFIYFDLSPCLK